MSDEPYFPAPGAKREPYREPEKAPPAVARPIVTRAEPPPESQAPRAALTRDEMHALLAVSAAQRPPWKRSVKRSAILVPIGLIGHGLDILVGSFWSMAIIAVMFVAALAWIARPLFRKDGFS